MIFSSTDDEFLLKLESGQPSSWDHRAHLRLAWVYLTKFGRQIGKDKIFATIQHVIKTSDVARKTTFHLTMTYFWIQVNKNVTTLFSAQTET